MMRGIRIAAMALVAAGALGLLFDAFTYTKDAYRLHVGGVVLMLQDRETVHIPTWVSLGAMAAGALLLVVSRRKYGT